MAPAKWESGAIRVPFFRRLETLAVSEAAGRGRALMKAAVLSLTWGCLVIAAARPTVIGDAISLPTKGRDLMLAVDISTSMNEDDMLIDRQYISRVDAVKHVVGEFVRRRQGDRIGLILFGEQAYLQTPLTFDTQTATVQLREAIPGFAGNATAIGDAIGLAVKTLRDKPAQSRVCILLTDGANTAGADPKRAADIAAEAGIRIHTVGVGADSKVVRDLFGQRVVNPSTALDETMLQYIAETTGGRYYRARDPDQMEEIYQQINQLEPIAEEVTYRPQRSLYHWPLGAALFLSMLLAVVWQRQTERTA